MTLLNFDPTNTIPVGVNGVTNAPAGSTKIRMYVLANDSDPDGDPLTISAVSTTTKGTCGITADTAGVQHLLYRPNATFTVSDGRGGTATAQATVNIGP